MNNPARLSIASAALLVAASVYAQAPSRTSGQAGQDSTAAAPSPGLAVVNRSCTGCHDSGLILQARPVADWPPIIGRMRANGAALSDADARVLLSYLTQNYSIKR